MSGYSKPRAFTFQKDRICIVEIRVWARLHGVWPLHVGVKYSTVRQVSLRPSIGPACLVPIGNWASCVDWWEWEIQNLRLLARNDLKSTAGYGDETQLWLPRICRWVLLVKETRCRSNIREVTQIQVTENGPTDRIIPSGKQSLNVVSAALLLDGWLC
jgi:hypothetical protein